MSSNPKILNYNDFKSICRICLLNSNLKPIQNRLIIEVLHNLTGIRFETLINDELPQQICLKCCEKINEIHEFTMRCSGTQSSLIKCLTNHKTSLLNSEQKQNGESLKTEDITIDEHKIEFVPVDELEIKQEILEDTTSGLIPETTQQNYEFLTPIINISNLNNTPKNPLENSKEKKYLCNVCNKRFMNLASFKRHRNLHSGKRPYVCDICNKAFAEAGTLRGHKRTHSGERPYKCDICFKAYTGANNLKLHQVKHSGEYPFKCDICNKAFNDVRVLRNHLATHSSERPFECNACTKTFKLSSDLIRHRRIHSVERPYECNVCPKTFQYSSTLVRHKRIHSGERPYKCDLCSQGFIESSGLKKHKLMHENGKIKREFS